MHVRATPDKVEDALRMLAAEWSGEVIKPKPHLDELWSTVRVTDRAASTVAPLLSEILDAPVLVVRVAGERFSLSYWQPGAQPIRADGYNDVATKELAAAIGTDTTRLQNVLRDPLPAINRHTDAADLLGPAATGGDRLRAGLRRPADHSAVRAAKGDRPVPSSTPRPADQRAARTPRDRRVPGG